MAQRSINNRYEVLIIGGSAGGLEIILQLLPLLHIDLAFAIIVVLHRKNGESVLVELLNSRTPWIVKEAEEKETIKPGTVYVAPADYHLMVETNKTFSLDYSEKVHFSRPAIDVTFETAVEVYGSSVIALLLSGANADGAEGLQKIKKAGGLTIVQDPGTASVSYMPQQAINQFEVDYILEPEEIPTLLNSLHHE